MSRSYPHICLLWKGSHCDDKKMVHHCWIRIFIKTGCPFYTVEYEASKIWCSSFKGHYICIVAVQQNQSANFIKVGNSWKISFYKLPLYFCNTIVNSIISTTTVYLVLPNISRIFELLLRIQGIYAPLGTNITWLSTGSLFILNSYLTLIQTHQMFSLSRDIWAALTRPGIHWFTEHIIDLQPDFKE